MVCKRMQRRISDDLDGALSPAAKAKLDAHLTRCPACRNYRAKLSALQAVSGRFSEAGQRPEDVEAMIARLRRAIAAEEGQGGRRGARAAVFSRRWAWAGLAAVLVAGIVGLYFLVSPGRDVPEAIQTSFEDSWSSISGRLDENPELAVSFASSLRESLAEPLREIEGEVLPLMDHQTLFLEDLSDEEVRIVNAEIAREIVQ